MRRLAGCVVLGAVVVYVGLTLSAGLASIPAPLGRAAAQTVNAPQTPPQGDKTPKPDHTPDPTTADQNTPPPDQTPTARPTPPPTPTPTPPPAVIVPGTLPPVGAGGVGTLSTPPGLSNIPAAAPTTVPQNNGSNPTPLVLLGILVLALLAVGAFALSLTLR